MLSHCLCQSRLAGGITAFCGGGDDGFHGGLLLLCELFQAFSFLEQQFKIFSLYFRQDSGSLHIAFTLGMHICRPVQRRTDAGGIPESLVAQSMHLWRRRLCRTAQKLVDFALERHEPFEFRLDRSYQLYCRTAHYLSNTSGGNVEVLGDLRGSGGILRLLAHFPDELGGLCGCCFQGLNGIGGGDGYAFSNLLCNLTDLLGLRAWILQLLGRQLTGFEFLGKIPACRRGAIQHFSRPVEFTQGHRQRIDERPGRAFSGLADGVANGPPTGPNLLAALGRLTRQCFPGGFGRIGSGAYA